jgi:hypothetical protein
MSDAKVLFCSCEAVLAAWDVSFISPLWPLTYELQWVVPSMLRIRQMPFVVKGFAAVQV